VIASLGMSFAFFLPTLIHGSWFVALTPYLDQIVAIILSLFMLPTPIKSVITGLRDLFLLAPEEETLDSIKSLITPLLREYGYTDLYFDIVRTGRKLWISVYITFDKDLVSISTFTTLQNKIIASLQTEYQDFYFELLPDIKYTKSTS
ncbi:MAG: cation transporter, partial [Acetivibrio sp.]